MEYRAKRLSPEWLRIATLDTPHTHCIYKCYIAIEGEVVPCNWLTHMSAGNIYEKSFIDIHEPNKEMLHFKTIKIKGKCAACEHNDVCFGCRGAAWRYLGDIEASDPKCWRNPEAPQYVWQTGSATSPDQPYLADESQGAGRNSSDSRRSLITLITLLDLLFLRI